MLFTGVVPAKAGIQRLCEEETLGPRFRGDDADTFADTTPVPRFLPIFAIHGYHAA